MEVWEYIIEMVTMKGLTVLPYLKSYLLELFSLVSISTAHKKTGSVHDFPTAKEQYISMIDLLG